jgi:HNH endonuclease
MPFPPNIKAEALVASGRCCCICHRQCGVRIECHHIVPDAQGGSNLLENCIPLCFDCHAEVEHYNPQHPKGNKFTPVELRNHRDKWYQQCAATEELQAIDPDDLIYLQRAIKEQKVRDFMRSFNGDDWK